jgi:hypothetical protein
MISSRDSLPREYEGCDWRLASLLTEFDPAHGKICRMDFGCVLMLWMIKRNTAQ